MTRAKWDELVECVSCGYRSDEGLLHRDPCRLITYEWIRQDGPRKEGWPMEPLRQYELDELEAMIAEMEKRGATRQPDGYFGKCVI